MAILHGNWITHRSFPSDAAPQPDAADQYFLLWGETWRRVEPMQSHSSVGEGHSGAIDSGVTDFGLNPFCMTEAELRDWLRSLHQARTLNWTIAEFALEVLIPTGSRSRKRAATVVEPVSSPRWQSVSIALPTYLFPSEDPEHNSPAVLPQHSVADVLPEESQSSENLPELQLQTWQVQGIRLTIDEALAFLQSLPLSSVNDDLTSWMGADLRFWSHIRRWHLDLMARAKFLPLLQPQDDGAIIHWQVLIDSAVDQARLEQFARQMPPLCRTYFCRTDELELSCEELENSVSPIDAHTLLLNFLNQATHTRLRSVAAVTPLPTTTLIKDLPLKEWLQASGTQPILTADPVRLDRLQNTLKQWLAPVQPYLSQQIAAFRTCFYLHPPREGQQDWTLEYFLQATNDPEFLVSARTVWQNPVARLEYLGRTIDAPQETLLAGLGLASRLYPLLEPSLQQQQPQSCLLNPLQVYEFIKSTAWRLQDSGFGVVLPPSLSQQEGWANRLGLRIQAETPKLKPSQRLGLQSLLNFKWELTIGGQRLSKAEFDRLVTLNTPLVEINGEWVELRSQDIRAAQTFFESRKDQMALSLEDALRISTGDTQVIEKLPVLGFEASGALQELVNTLTKGNQSVEPIPVPEAFQGELRPYQVRGASWLAFLERWGLGACLADDMGLGKTPQCIAFLLYLLEQDALTDPVLIVCPTSVLGNWEREVKRFAPDLKTLVHHGDKRSQGKAFAKAVKGNHLVITSYPLVYRDLKDLQTVSWQGIVLDEAQNIKNADAKQSQAVRQLQVQFRVALTGTPVENRLAELWSIMDFLNPGYLGPKNFFQRRFAIPIERYGDTASLKTLRSLVQPFMLRRLKTDRSIIQDLPEKQEMTVFCGLTSEQADLYQRFVEQSLTDIESAEGIQRKGKILALITRLKQICNHPALLGDETAMSKAAHLDAHSGKVQRLEAMLEEVLAEGDRSLIFTQFAEWGKLLQAYLKDRFSRDVFFLYGSTAKKQREEMIDRFQNDPQAPRIFILSLKAGGVGLNLTRANHVFHFDRWWNPAVENQATDRVFRIGQKRNVQVHKFVCNGTLEERIHELIESKKALSEQVVGTGENWLTELDTDALRNLLLLDRSAVIEDEDS
ncbi:DEAD/DEAH box helicase [Cyanobacteria bacterium FACHB-502]|nr:DEAD/DEAH box helicase [Cyanobacteria bacterium FACHB-502]MBD2023393.1 DEAD/DEAH box helicase [Leptolyngbya sp. FACHB-711]